MGFAIYSFEGIGIVMPVFNACEKPESFNKILIAVIVTLVIVFIGFSELCYLNWGSNLTEPIVTELLPKDDKTVIATKILYSLVLLPSTVLNIHPVN